MKTNTLNHEFLGNQKRKILYLSPATEIFELTTEGVMAVSGGEYPEWTGDNI